MGCCARFNSKYSPEYRKFFKPENNVGCGVRSLGCDTPSLAMEGTPRYEWEQIHGKLVTTLTYSQDAQGHPVTLIERHPCPQEERSQRHPTCCSLKYSVVR